MEIGGDMNMKMKLIENVKHDVKQIMELVVTCKTVSKESVCVKKLCISVELCVHFGLRRKILGLLKTKSSSFALLHKIAKHCPDAAFIITKMTNFCYKFEQTSSNDSDVSTKRKSYLWVEIALFEKRLIPILEYLISNASKYYENNSIMIDSESSAILVSLLVGPTSIDYHSKDTQDTIPFRTCNLIQRNHLSFSLRRKPRTIPATKDKVECISCLHQNVNSDLIYGKNNILISNPVNSDQLVAGYLSLHKIHHQDRDELVLKWTANQLIFSISDSLDNDNERTRSTNTIEINIDDILYIHCHQNEICDSPELIYSLESNLIFIDKDGVQRPPINFSQIRNMVTFLTCLETGLLPNGRLDPPICNTAKSRGIKSGYCVFKIIDNSILNEEIRTKSDNEIMKRFLKNTSSSTSSSTTSVDNPHVKINQFSSSIRHNILKRAFYGWLTYCRHLATIRMHLAQLIYEKSHLKNHKTIGQVNKLLWSEYMEGNQTKNEIYNLIYTNGIDSEIRCDLWPYLLGVYDWDANETDRRKVFHENQIHYEKKLSEWSTAEIIIQQKPRDEFNDSRSSDNISPTNSVENLFTNETLGDFSLNLQHIDKDVHRCDRNYPYFSNSKNLTKLRNVITTFIWENLDIGYMQGFVDIVAPLLVIFDEETITYACFTQLMKRLIKNFPSMSADMDLNLINLKSLVQMFDNELYVLLMEKSCRNSDMDYGMRFFFSYRWFLLDFKREFPYTDLFLVWETIWAAEYLVTANFQLFIAFALLELYRRIFITNKMDFTDIMKFFNDMAEHHDINSVLHLARDLVSQLQDVINKD